MLWNNRETSSFLSSLNSRFWFKKACWSIPLKLDAN